jgi:hypothetical protein
MKRIKPLILIVLTFGYCEPTSVFAQLTPARWTAHELRAGPASSPPVELYRPVDMAFDGDGLFVLDMDDDNVKVFSKAGSFRYTFGRKGQGPGEFHRPSGLDVQDARICVADSGNRRIQIIDKRGSYLSGFKVPFLPFRILALENNRIVVLGLPSGRTGPEKLLHCYDGQGRLLWEAVDSFHSRDSVYDLMRNRMFIRKAPGGEFFLIPNADDRTIRRMNAAGRLLGEIKVAESYPLKEVTITVRGGQKRTLHPLCWNCALDRETLYLLIPERTEDGDLGPGRTIAAIDRRGDHIALISLPAKVSRIAVESGTIFGLDLDSRLRLFTTGSQ